MLGKRSAHTSPDLNSALVTIGTGVCYNFSDLSVLPIQDTHLYSCTVDGHRAAADPRQSIQDCPYGPSTDTRIRCYRIAWRTAFKRARERGQRETAQAWRIAA